MHSFTIQTKFTFGDRVRFNSRTQGCSGIGEIAGLTIGKWGGTEVVVDYMIMLDLTDDELRVGTPDIQPGILESEIELESEPT